MTMMLCVLQEVAEPLHDLKQGMEDLKNNKTFKFILAAMLQIGNFLNGANVSTCIGQASKAHIVTILPG